MDESCIISRYIPNPLLINGLKFDLRIYVVVTCMDPLRIYIYNEGLTRFATEKYKLSDCKSNRFAHLTNYSVNKKNDKFVPNTSANDDGKGSKWSLSALFKHLEVIGVDCDLLWSRIYDIIIKAFISVEGLVGQALKRLACHRTNCFELFGFDILVDSELHPWLMEVNLTPSLACESPLDLQIKSNLIADLFTLVGVQQFDRKKDSPYCKPKPANFCNLKDPLRSLLPAIPPTVSEDVANTLVYAKIKAGCTHSFVATNTETTGHPAGVS